MENTQNLPDYIVYTDGGCAINPGGHGAYAAIIIHTDTGEIEEYWNSRRTCDAFKTHDCIAPWKT